jgi:hypothetical protein
VTRTSVVRERDDAGRLVELLQPPENLCLLRREALRRERRIGRLDASRTDVVEPSAECDRALGAEIASIEVRGPFAARQRFDEGALGEVSATKNPVTEPHDSSSCLILRQRPRRRAGPAGDGWRGRDGREPSIR